MSFALGWVILGVLAGICAVGQGYFPRKTAPTAWDAPPVLIQLYTGPGYVSEDYAWGVLPEFVLYADGRVLLTRGHSILMGQLTPSEVCSLLVEIEADGFFDFSPLTYPEPQVTDNGTTYISVAGWRARGIRLYALDFALEEASQGMGLPVPRGVERVYQRLSTYEVPETEPYEPQRAALFIAPYSSFTGEETQSSAPLWPLTPSLTELRRQAGAEEDEGQAVLVEGEVAAAIFSEMDGAWGTRYREGDETFEVLVRPMLPQERFDPEDGPWRNPPEYEGESTTLDCTDVPLVALPIPTLTPPVTPEAATSTFPNPLEHVGTLGKRDEPGQLNWASDLVVTAQSEVVVADSHNHRLQYFSLDGTYLREVVLPEESYPHALDLGQDGTLLVGNIVARTDHEVLILAEDGRVQQTLAGWPAPEGTDETPLIKYMAQGPDGRFYLAEREARRVIILSPEGQVQEIWKVPSADLLGNLVHNDISDLTVDTQGNLYVSLSREERIVQRHPSGEITEIPDVEAWAMAATFDGALYFLDREEVWRYESGTGEAPAQVGELPNYSSSLAAAPDGSFVALLGRETFDAWEGMGIVRYLPGDPAVQAAFGTILLQPGQFRTHLDFAVAPEGDVWLIEPGEDTSIKESRISQLIHLSATDQPLGQFDSLGGAPFQCDRYALAASTQMVAVSDPCAGQVLLLSTKGELVARWGTRGTGPGEFNLSVDLAFAPDEHSLYLVDAGNRRLTHWSLAGELLAEWSAASLSVEAPVALDLAADGTLFVLDEGERQVVALAADGATRLIPLPERVGAVRSLGVSPDGKALYIGGWGNTLFVVNDTGEFLGGSYLFNQGPAMIEVSADGRIYGSTGVEEIYLYGWAEDQQP